MNAPTMKTESRTARFANILTNVWLIVLALIVGVTVIITSIIVGYPVVSYLTAKFFG